MELQVSAAPGRCDCFAALPLQAIYELQGRDSEIFSAILELRLPDGDGRNQGPWYLAWAGAASTSSSIEISTNLADCLGLLCNARFNVKARRDVPSARTIELEPVTVDDWEILELNAGFVEDHILSQVGVLAQGQQFPIWVEGGTVLMLHVLSAEPKGVVKLVPGTELIVAPKVGRISGPKTFIKESSIVQAWLRVQKLHPSLMQLLETGNCTCYVAPTTTVFVSEETANSTSFQNGQLVVVTSVERTSKQMENFEMEKQEETDMKVVGNVPKSKSVVLRLVSCHLVAEGHAMLATPLCQLIGAPVHSRIELKSLLGGSTLVRAGAEISPIQFKGATESRAGKMEDRSANVSGGNYHEDTASRWEKHRLHLQRMSNQTSIQNIEEPNVRVLENEQLYHDSKSKEGKNLCTLWLAMQAKACLSYLPVEECGVVPINQETVMEFLVEHKMAAVCQNGSNGGLLARQIETLDFLLTLEHWGSEHEVTSSSSRPDGSNLLLLDTKAWEGEESKCGATLQPIKVGCPKYIPSSWKGSPEHKTGPSLTSLPWLKGPAADALQRLQVCLSPRAQAKRANLGLPSPGYVLLYGPPACGKTKLALAIARELEEDPSILAHKVVIKCTELSRERSQAVRGAIQDAVFEAFQCGPSIVIFDDLDVVIPSNSGSESSEPSTTSVILSEFLSDVLDSFRHVKGHQSGRDVAFLAIARAVSSLPTALCSSGRFDLHVSLSAPANKERTGILLQEIKHRGLVCEEYVVSEAASKCDGYDMADLEILVDRSVLAARPRLRGLSKGKEHDEIPQLKPKSELLKEDFQRAMEGFLPVSMRDIGRPTGGQVGPSTWEEVGGLHGTCRALQEMLELPVKYSKIFSKAPLRLRTGVLLYGPPGCGKTHVVGIAAAACSLRLISVKGPEILNKYIGASEQGVRDIFSKASAAAPCILFFDEFDAIAPKRGHDNTGVTDRVVNQLLTELDGVEALNGVFVFAASSRPDLLDAALLRPGRLDRLLLCDFPTASERLEILQVLSRKLPLAEDVRLDVVASLTNNFSGADLQAVLSDAQLEAVHCVLSGETNGVASDKLKHPIITMGVLTSVLRKARPSVSEHERLRLYGIYDAFVSSRSSLSAKARDDQGKRVTLA